MNESLPEYSGEKSFSQSVEKKPADEMSSREKSESEEEDYMANFQNTLESLLTTKNDTTEPEKSWPSKGNVFVTAPPNVTPVDPQALQKEIEKFGSIRGREPLMPIDNWLGFGLSDECVACLQEMKCTQPVAVQCLSIPALLHGRDTLVVAETGSGKTLCYCIPLLRHVTREKQQSRRNKGPFAAILVCSRELADQVGNILRTLLSGTNITLCVAHGGRDLAHDLVAVSTSCDVFIGCPGRTVDILTKRKNAHMFKKIRFIAFDEADRLFDEGFKPQIEKICALLPRDAQRAMFSATMPGFIEKYARKLLKNPLHIAAGSRLGISHTLEQSVEIFQKEEDRFFRLLEILGEYVNQQKQVLIFVEKRNDLEELYVSLQMHGHKSLTIYAEMDPIDRSIALQDFTSSDIENTCHILIATGLAARGVDIPHLPIVVNYTTPSCLEDYVHRVGRTARGGMTGKSITFLLQPYENIHSLYLLQVLHDGPTDANTLEALRKIAGEVCGDKELVMWTPEASYRSYAGRGYAFDRDERKKSQKRKRLHQKEKMLALGMGGAPLDPQGEKSQALVALTDGSAADRGAAPVVSNLMKATGKELALKAGDAKARAIAIATAISEARELEATSGISSVKIPINDYSIRMRRMLTNRTILTDLMDDCTVEIGFHGEFTKGNSPADSKLHLVLSAPSRSAIEKAKEKVNALILHEKQFELI
ncbi:DEAD-domain-containing protein [Perkinsela sp. CCAP 1560/4]|nr:DEAD-domain-containing protein [Perkinsela sp. CCAP 1560/4]|eukprot:KNH06359.1 DEAD-domain-containing protein [Perkinsela sp. CCAP 1560/4]